MKSGFVFAKMFPGCAAFQGLDVMAGSSNTEQIENPILTIGKMGVISVVLVAILRSGRSV